MVGFGDLGTSCPSYWASMQERVEINRCRPGTEKEAPSLDLFGGRERETLESCILFKLEQDKVESQISLIFLVIFLL